jgi:hypothetical protein
MNRKNLVISFVLSFVIILVSSMGVAAEKPTVDPTVTQLASNLGSTSGSTVGPDGALYVAEREVGQDGRILRVDPQTGDAAEFASGLPQAQIPPGGVVDVAFIGNTAYALVTVVNDPLLGGGSAAAGIYRVDSPSSFTLIADIGLFSMNNVPTNTDIALTTGVQYALETFRGGFLVTDGHHNRVLRVTLDGVVSEMLAFDNTVPTGLEVHGNTVYIAEAGPTPHDPEDGKVVAFGPKSSTATEVASGAPLLVDVERGRGRTLYALSQGVWNGVGAGDPADADTGSLLEVNADGTFTIVTEDLDRPTSLEVIGNTAYVVTLTGEIWKIDGIGAPPYGVSR